MVGSKLKDEELIDLIHKGNEDAYFILIERYRPYAWKLANDFYRLNVDSGITLDEFMEIAFISIQTAVKKYESNTNAFYPYWKASARNEILRFIENNSYANGGKEFRGVSLDDKLDNNILLSDVMGKEDNSLHEKTVDEEFSILLNSSESGLSEEEIKVANYLLEGYTANDIAELTGFKVGKVYYLISNIKKALYDIIINRYFK